MNSIPDLIPLHDSRPGLRALVQVQVREASADGSQGSGAGPAVLDFVASTDTLDRYREILDPAGWRLDTYRRNPVFQNAHNYGDILFTIGKALVTEVRSGSSPHLYQRVQFATDVNPMARIAYGLYKGGFLNAVSVGFIPIRWIEPDGSEHGARGLVAEGAGKLLKQLSEGTAGHGTELKPGVNERERGASGGTAVKFRRKYLEQELLEVSAVAIPANPDALALGLKAGAVEKADLQETADLLRSVVGTLAISTDASLGGGSKAVSPLRSATALHMTEANGEALLNVARTLRDILRHT